MEHSLPLEKKKSTLFTTGLALFSMFFGAGNLIFPLLIGKSVGDQVWYAISGLALTAVIVPFLGLAAMILFEGDYKRFFGRIGKVPGFLLLLLLQLILGPLGVIPRLVTLMHATAASYLHSMPLYIFSILIALLIFASSFRRTRLISYLGSYLTPLLLLSLAALFFLGFISGSSAASELSSKESFFQGLLGGYNTMDLIAAFLFATIILPHFHKETQTAHPALRKQELLKKVFLSGLIAAFLLFLTYVGLCLISSRHPIDPSYPSEQMLGAIAMKLLGPIGGCIAAVAVITACLTTAMTLASIFADYLRKDLCKEKISQNLSLIITLSITMLFASLGFEAIAAFLSPILQVVYPGLILLTILNLFHSLYGYRMIKTPIFITFASAGILYLV
jgi:branched-chain amino acid:cation transporter, LIVCS family